jgi:hypothetical protein
MGLRTTPAAARRRLGRVVLAFLLRACLRRTAPAGAGFVTPVVMAPLAAVIGAATVVTVVVVVVVLKVTLIVTGPQVITVGSMLVNSTGPH